MAEAERAGAETRDRAARAERLLGDLGAVKRFQAIAGGIAKRDQRGNAPRVGQGLRLGGHLDPGGFQPGGERIELGCIGDFPAEEARTLRRRAVDDDALLAVVHPERQ